MLAFNTRVIFTATLLIPVAVLGQDAAERSGREQPSDKPSSNESSVQDRSGQPSRRRFSIRDAFPPQFSPPKSRGRTIYGHQAIPYPAYVGAWGTGWHAWGPSGGADGLGYRYQYHTHVPGLGVKYYRGPVARYYPGPYGASPLTGFSHYGYGPYGW